MTLKKDFIVDLYSHVSDYLRHVRNICAVTKQIEKHSRGKVINAFTLIFDDLDTRMPILLPNSNNLFYELAFGRST